ncbi:Sodium channel modifier 1 [Mactra antiquata]
MSFKRDGDDVCALSNQRKKRVSDLLHEDITDEEISKLSNGRYICKLCVHGPIFDTLDMFYVHKQGKKHQASIQYAEQKKQELWDLIQKRKHEDTLRTNGPSVTEQVCQSGTDSNERKEIVKKPRRKPYDRKTILDVDSSCVFVHRNNDTNTVSRSELPGCRNHLNIPGSSQSGVHGNRSTKSNFVNNGFSMNSNKDLSVSIPKSDVNKGVKGKLKGNATSKTTNTDKIFSSKDVQKIVGLSNPELRNKFYLARKRNFPNNEQSSEGCVTFKTEEISNQTVSPYQVWDYYKNFKPKSSANVKHMNETMPSSETSDKINDTANDNDISHARNTQINKERAEKMLHAFGSGWKKDWNGEWIKDDNVEFDSDDEPPDVS